MTWGAPLSCCAPRSLAKLSELQILTPVGRHKEFLLGDLPAITINRASDEIGPGVPIDQADEIVMPLTSRLLVSVGLPDGTRSISNDEVDSYNALQARLARDYLIHHTRAPTTESGSGCSKPRA